jgi:hypothetical protein
MAKGTRMNDPLRRASDLTADELATAFEVLRCICRDYERLRDAAPHTDIRRFAQRRIKHAEAFMDEIHDRYDTAKAQR